MRITEMMQKAIEDKEILNNKLTDLSNQLVSLEIKEFNKRTDLMNKLEKEAHEQGKKITDKTKTAHCDTELKNEMNKIKHLKKDIDKVKREIGLCNDKISLARNMIRELQLEPII